MEKEILLPKISDNIDVVTVTEILVSVGDEVEEEDSLITVESEKASLEVPTEFSGRISKILVSEGDQVKIGAPIIIIATEDTTESAPAPEPQAESSPKSAPEQKEEVVPASKPEPIAPVAVPAAGNGAELHTTDKNIPVSPLARKIARDMQVDLHAVMAQSGKSRITVDDVKAFAAQPAAAAPASAIRSVQTIGVPDFNQWGAISREKMSSIRKITAKNTSFSWQTMPHVTHFDEADITNLEAFRKKFNSKNKSGVTITSILLKIIGMALQQYPKFNASIDEGQEEIIYKQYYHIGVAADTKDGLLMPVIQNVDQKGILDMSDELGEKAGRARERKLLPEEMSGQTFVISNLGGIGGVGFTPVVFPNNSSILGVSRASMKPVYDRTSGEFKPRLIAPLSLSYDHRVIDGAEAARFMRWVCQGLEQPIQLLF